MIGFGMDAKGLKELDNKLKRLPIKVAQKIARKAITKPALVIKERVQAAVYAWGDVGDIVSDSMESAPSTKRGQYKRSVRIGRNEALVHIAKDGRRSYIPSAIEYGHGSAAPIPVIRQTIDASEQMATNMAIKILKNGIEKEATKK